MAQAGMMGYGFNPAMMSNPMFRPAIVISSMDNQFEGGSLETQLLALNSAVLLATNNNWWNLFRPNPRDYNYWCRPSRYRYDYCRRCIPR